MPGTKAPVSAVIVCQNEHDLIGECLDSLEFCAEIVIVDEAIELAKRFGSDSSGRFVNGVLDGFLKSGVEAVGEG